MTSNNTPAKQTTGYGGQKEMSKNTAAVRGVKTLEQLPTSPPAPFTIYVPSLATTTSYAPELQHSAANNALQIQPPVDELSQQQPQLPHVMVLASPVLHDSNTCQTGFYDDNWGDELIIMRRNSSHCYKNRTGSGTEFYPNQTL